MSAAGHLVKVLPFQDVYIRATVGSPEKQRRQPECGKLLGRICQIRIQAICKKLWLKPCHMRICAADAAGNFLVKISTPATFPSIASQAEALDCKLPAVPHSSVVQ